MKRALFISLLLFFSWGQLGSLFAADQHEHEHEHEHEDTHKEEKPPNTASNIGPEKGVTHSNEEGFSLSKEAVTTFSLTTISLKGAKNWVIPFSALVQFEDNTSVYRVKGEFYKRIDITVKKHLPNSKFLIESKELRSGDTIVSNGVGFLRIVEVDITSGSSGHHH